MTYGVLLIGAAACSPETDRASRSSAENWANEFANPTLEPFLGDLPEMRERRLIRALVTPSRTDFFVDSGRIRGIQAEFLREFGERLNEGVRDETQRVRIEFVPVPFNQLIPALLEGRGDIAAGFLTVTEQRSADVTFAEPFRRDVREVIVTSSEADPPSRIEDLAGRQVYVLSSSSYLEHLERLNQTFAAKGLAPIDVEEADERLRSEDILELIHAGVVDATAIDDYKAELWANVFDGIRVHQDLALSEGNQVAWAVRPDSKELEAALNAFVAEAREGALLGNILLSRYFGSERWISNPNAAAERDKLRRYLGLFERYGERFGIDPLALAAQAYQESRLDPRARSEAGAVGLMQVLPTTASDPQIAVENIDDPEANVHAGAKYLAFIRDRYFSDPELSEWTQRAFAWAAYNAGPRRIVEARALAPELGLDPNQWFGNVEVATARLVGREPVRYVANIHRYHVAYRLSWINAEMRREASEALDPAALDPPGNQFGKE